MSDVQPAGPIDTAPAAPVPPAPSVGDAGAAPTPDAVHPSWVETFDKAGIPDLLRPTLIEKIRADEAAVQRQIEAARGNVPPEWQEILTEARAQGITPKELYDSYNAISTLREDPLAFRDQLSAEIDAAVAAGRLTPREGQQAQQQIDNATDADLFEADPTAKALKEIQQRQEKTERELAERNQREQAEREQREQEQAAREQEQWLDNFFGSIKTTLSTHPSFQAAFADPESPTAVNAQITVARIAGGILDGGRAKDEAEAIQMAITQLESISATPKPAPGAIPPISGGGNAMPGQAPAGKMSEAQREAAMLAEGLRWQGQ